MAKSTEINNMRNFSPEQIRMATEAIKSAKDITCKCGADIFAQGVKLKEISAILSPEGEPKLIPLPVFYCIKCQKQLNLDEPEVPETSKNEEIISIDFKPKSKND